MTNPAAVNHSAVRPRPMERLAPFRIKFRCEMQGTSFAFGSLWPYLAVMTKYSPLVSEFGSAEEEAAYNEWLKRKVAESLADGKPTIPHDEVMARIDAIIERAKDRNKAC